MVEIYLFVNPLGDICLDVEKNILCLMEENNTKIQFRIIPLLNLRTINDLMKRLKIPLNDIDKHNKLSEDIYSASLDYKAAQLQGKKKGCYFLLHLQEMVTQKHIPYSTKLSEQLLTEIGIDLDMYKADRQSEFVKESFQADQKIAQEMKIAKHPTIVIYNYACERDFGVLLEDCSSIEEINRLCEIKDSSLSSFHYSFLHSQKKKICATRHLHLIN
ncbi:DsbA family protein [Melissococcus plutonius]|uniref:Thioredoxin-fold protein n=1 Tax=Melissococcus plutonius TaxID=33970 RepID=A0A2Z5Y395_9ENTE|nr:DsbA family protein [Melissococcus plutonius]BAL62415.1 YjbH-like, GTP pyrophosphokinase domain [Melissococcus plutonius DAT561]MCV2498184.1 DsbA family protein [Melissococcus plutonius]MCV2500895.1 DsbA family protein [Melissococcus plutonius]MCV2504263.1 DsbA family protein [Melissococcus plutonius]MCV2506799.1 DsbA family protein [Melissococcus plutonius]